MNVSRKKFIKAAAILSAASLNDIDAYASSSALNAESGRVIKPDDENYWSNARRQFPLTKKRAYLNNGTLGPSPFSVIEAIKAAMMRNDQRGEYSGYEKCISSIAEFVNVGENEIALTSNTTEGINIACWGLPLKKKDEVILTSHEHVGNAMPWLNRHKLHGIKLKTFQPAPTASETLERIKALITRRTKVIAVPHILCTQGQVLPVKEICALAKEHGLYSCIDGAHGPGMLQLDLKDLGCDTYASCSHKWLLGPKGSGFLYVNKDVQNELQPYFVGSSSTAADWSVEKNYIPEYVDSAHRYFGGTQSLSASEGIIAAIQFMNVIGMQNVQNRVKYLGTYLQKGLLDLGDKVELLTPTEELSYAGINSFRIKGFDFKKFNIELHSNDLRTRAVPESGLDCIRISTHIYNNTKELDKLLAFIKSQI